MNQKRRIPRGLVIGICVTTGAILLSIATIVFCLSSMLRRSQEEAERAEQERIEYSIINSIIDEEIEAQRVNGY